MEKYRLNRIQEVKKRIFDVSISLIGVIISSPIMIIIAIIVKLDSKGPVIYKQKRITQNGKEFVIYKFRTMIKDAEKETRSYFSV